MNLSAETAWAIARLEAELPNLAVPFPDCKWEYDSNKYGSSIFFRPENRGYSPIQVDIFLTGSVLKIRLLLLGSQQDFDHIDAAIARIHEIGKGFSKE
jgi:hypothetical protein